MCSNEDFISIVPYWFQVLPQFRLIYHFFTDPAATFVHDSGHKIVSLCKSVCEEETAQLLNLLMNTKSFRLDSIWAIGFLNAKLFMLLAELNEKPNELQQGPSRSPQRVLDNTNTSGDKNGNSVTVKKFFQRSLIK